MPDFEPEVESVIAAKNNKASAAAYAAVEQLSARDKVHVLAYLLGLVIVEGIAPSGYADAGDITAAAYKRGWTNGLKHLGHAKP